MRSRHRAGGHLVVRADHGGERDALVEQVVQRLAAAGLVVVTLVQQARVERDAGLGERALVTLQALLRVDPVERAGDVRDLPVLESQQRLRGEITAELVVETEAAIRECRAPCG